MTLAIINSFLLGVVIGVCLGFWFGCETVARIMSSDPGFRQRIIDRTAEKVDK